MRTTPFINRRRRTGGAVRLRLALFASLLLLPACHDVAGHDSSGAAPSAHPATPALPSLHIARTIHVGGTPSGIAVADGSLWVANADGNTVWRVDPRTGKVLATIGRANYGSPTYGAQDYVDAGYGAVWVTSDVSNNVREIDPRTDRIVRTVGLTTNAGTPLSVAVGDGSVWVTDFPDNRLLRIDPRTGRAAGIRTRGPTDVAVTSRWVWVVDHGVSNIARVDPVSERVSVVVHDISSVPERIAVGFGSVWVSDPRASCVFRLDERTAARQATVRLPDGLPVYEEAAGPGTLWVAAGPKLFAVDPRTNSIAGSVEIGSANSGGQDIGSLVVAHGDVWVTSLQGDLYLVAPPEASSPAPTP